MLLRTRCGTSGIRELEGGREARMQPASPNTNLIEPRTVVPALFGRHEPGEFRLGCAVLATDRRDVDGFAAVPPPPDAMRELLEARSRWSGCFASSGWLSVTTIGQIAQASPPLWPNQRHCGRITQGRSSGSAVFSGKTVSSSSITPQRSPVHRLHADFAHGPANRNRFSGGRPCFAMRTNSASTSRRSSAKSTSPFGSTTPSSRAPSWQTELGHSTRPASADRRTRFFSVSASLG